MLIADKDAIALLNRLVRAVVLSTNRTNSSSSPRFIASAAKAEHAAMRAVLRVILDRDPSNEEIGEALE